VDISVVVAEIEPIFHKEWPQREAEVADSPGGNGDKTGHLRGKGVARGEEDVGRGERQGNRGRS
jgi:hypothetical protein